MFDRSSGAFEVFLRCQKSDFHGTLLNPHLNDMAGEMWTCFEADQPSGWTEAEFRRFTTNSEWTFAKTMPQNPHEYTLRRNSDSGMFDSAVRFIREQGRLEIYQGKPYKTLYLDKHQFWTMGAPLKDTILINRKPVSSQHAERRC